MDALTQARVDAKFREVSEYIDNAFAHGHRVEYEGETEHSPVRIEIDVFAALRVVQKTSKDKTLLKLSAIQDPKIQRAIAFASSGQNEGVNKFGVRVKLVSAQTDQDLKDGPWFAERADSIANLVASRKLSPKRAATEWLWLTAEKITNCPRPTWGDDPSIQQTKCKLEYNALKKRLQRWQSRNDRQKRYA